MPPLSTLRCMEMASFLGRLACQVTVAISPVTCLCPPEIQDLIISCGQTTNPGRYICKPVQRGSKCTPSIVAGCRTHVQWHR